MIISVIILQGSVEIMHMEALYKLWTTLIIICRYFIKTGFHSIYLLIDDIYYINLEFINRVKFPSICMFLIENISVTGNFEVQIATPG